ncbi:trimeric autotransporter adhesin Ata [Acinetobacter baumannii]|uniref:trimeric autotransporter adhesin Ata n=1 Tax=Acinetobacter baumannii TaxID=470 RepID=UPI0024DE7FB7|nr:trimeric autotransporter adhesin Ata [Acinetobacter baumannii]MDK2171322.1 trimeric autotransporter adhesin Ata [Acinetobacter baumannii]MDK2182096.1 trimeric autotransporter adhesin Ata [Acinetobacter baumannii]MDK2327980.1 trimeric autotransporter adhesin Ata [Acinetobacter baumannii]
MNKVYKVIWNASIGAWVATSEIAKGKTKTKSKTLNLSAAVLSGVICFAPNAFAGTNTEGGIGQGTSISGTTSCREGNANTANQKDIAIGCGAQTQDRTGSNIANRNNPYNNSTGAYAGAMKQGGAISVGTGAVVEKGLGTAIGSYATTQGISGVAIGTGALSSGNTALAVGRQSAATADFSQAIGNVAAATGKGSLAIGHSATAEGYRSIAIGSPDIENADPVAGQAGAAYQPKMATKATGKDSIAFGGGAVATEENALAIGAFSESKGKKSVAIGTGAKAQKDNAVVIGDQAEASFEGGVAIGKGARSEAENSIALGKDSKASQATGESFLTKQSAPTGVLSIGDIGTERRIQNVADGAADSDAATVRQLKAARTHYVSINDNGQQGGNFENDGATGRNAIAVGVNASAAGREAMAIGGSAQAIGSGAIAMGSSSQTIGRGDVAIGRNASTKGAEGTPSGYSNQSIAIGDQTKAIGDQSIAIGADVIAKGNSSVAIGGDDVDKIAQDAELSKTYTEITGGVLKAGSYPTTEANHGSTAVGVQAVGTGAFSSAFGMTSKATGDASSAFGVMSNASGKGAAAFGAVAQATGDGASAMGINSLASGTNSTAIGSGNKPGEGAKATGKSAAAIGSGAQATGDNSAAIGKGAEATNENAAAVGGGAKATGKNAAAIGGGAIADQENAVAVGQGAQSLVEGGVALGARSKVEAKNSVALGQDAVATEATGSSFLTNRDASQSNGVISVGSAGKERRITNVEDGSADSDAVTVRQLKNVDSRVNQNTSNIGKNTQNITNLNQKLDDTKTNLGNQIADTNKNLNDAKKDLGNQITDTNTKLNTTKDQLTTQINDTKTELNNTIGNTKTELNSKIDNTKTELENKGLNFAGNSGTDVHRKLGDKLNIVGGAAASTPAAKTSGENVITRTTQDGIQIELLKDSKFDSVTTGNTTLNTNGLTIKEGPSITKQGINAGNKQITNVADGINAKDAVNKSQLDNLAAKQNATDDAAVKYDDAKTKDKVTLKGKDGTVLDNVKAGHISSTSKEAVNGSQIHKISNSIKNSIGGNTVVNPDGSLTTNNIGGTGKNNINDAISEVKNTATKAKTTVTEGDNIVVKETVNKDGSTNYEVSTKKDLTLNSVTTGDSVFNNNGLTIKEGPSITKEGINAGGKKITNVADGVNAKDAVNVDQLTKVKDNLNGRITDTNNQLNDAKKDLGNQIADTNKNLNEAKKDFGDQIADTNTKLNNTKDQLTTQINDTKTELNNTIGNTKTELNSKIDNTKTELENKGLNFAGNSGTDVHRKLGEKLNIVGGAAASTPVAKTSGENVITRTTKDGIQIELLKDSKFDSLTTGNTTLNTNGLTIKEGPSITKEGINAGGKKITNVADGINAEDAVNKSQLDNLAAKQNATDDAAVKYDDAKTKDKVTLKGKDGTVLDNVKAGHISSTSKEAVNGGQIHKISNSIKNSIGGNTVVNPDGSLTTNNIGGTGKNNINDAISEVKNTAMKAKTTVTEGNNIVVKETVNKDGSTNYEVSTKKDLTLDSVTAGDSVLNHNGLTIKDGPSVTRDGINAGGKKITDVSNGVIAQNSKDAVNGGQIHNNSTSIKNSIGGNTVVNPDGSLTTNNIGGTGKNNINDAIKSVDEKVTNGVNDLTQKGLNFGANDQKTTQGKAVHRKLGDTINIVGGADAKTAEDKTSGENIITRTTEDGVKIEMLKDVKFDSVNVGGHVLNQQGLIIKGGPSITVNGINAGGKQITNVADGINAKDAVNKGQLDKQINEVKDQIGKDIGKLSDHAVQYDKDKNGNVDKNSVTLGGGEKGTNLKNVADGKVAEGSKDAVNGGQLWNVQNQVDKNSNDIKNIQNNIDNISNGKAGLVQQQKPNGEITVGKDTGGTSINMAGKEGDRVVQGVKDGEIKAGSNQAVNGGQIHKISESIKNSIGGNTTIDPKDGSITTNNIGGTGKNNINDAIGMLNQSNQELGNKITNLGDQLQQVFYDTNKRIDDVEKKANAGIAAAMALENAPFVAGKYTYAVGAAYHGGENAVGVTLRKTSDNGRWSITGGVAAASQGEPSVRVGISGVIN